MLRVIEGDCLEVLRTLEPDSISACVTDPPYHLQSMVQRLSGTTSAEVEKNFTKTIDGQSTNPFAAMARGFMGKQWDGGDIAFRPETWRLVFNAMKPGAHLVAFGGTRTYHRMACAIEDAGFEIRDTLCWLYGTGFPKSWDVSKGIDKAAGAEREILSHLSSDGVQRSPREIQPGGSDRKDNYIPTQTAPATPDAIRWQGWGTALKPAFEPIILARKPLIGTVAANVLQHGTGAINIDACRVAFGSDVDLSAVQRCTQKQDGYTVTLNIPGHTQAMYSAKGRWPANVVHDGSEEVEAAFAAFGPAPGQSGAVTGNEPSSETNNIYGQFGGRPATQPRGDSGTASRFFKACEYTDSELLLCRAKAILAAWNPDLVSTADDCTCLSSEAVASALNDAAILASQGTQRSCPVASTNATPTELRRICETAIAVILSSAGKSSFGLPRENAFPNGCHARCVDQTRPTGITTITISHWKSDGSAAPVTFSITQANSAPGEAASEASRFHYSAKADKGDRADSRHPTVKPVDLIRYLVQLVTPPGGHILDPFAGTGTTGEAAMLLGFDCTMIERDPVHANDIRHRIKRWSGLDTPLFAEVS